MAKIELTAPPQKVLEINGKDYPLAQRTGALEKRIIEEHDRKLGKMTEFEQYEIIIDLLLGRGVFEELFPAGEDDNLDLMAQVAFVAQDEFNAEKRKIQRQKIDHDTEALGLDKMIETMGSFNKQVDRVMNNASAAKNMKKGRK